MKKNLIIISIVILLVLGLSFKLFPKETHELEEKEILTYRTSNHLSEDIRKNATDDVVSAVFTNQDISPTSIINEVDLVSIVSVITVDGADTKYEPSVGTTYGTLILNNILYGNAKQGEVIKYIKKGGIMSLEEWEKGQPEAARQKREEMRKENGIDASKIYYKLHFANDEIISEGKTYLAYLKYNKALEKYEIIGRENGLRELNVEKAKEVKTVEYNLQGYKIKNNITKEYEPLTDYITQYIN